MDLGRQWNERLKIWAEYMDRNYFVPVTEMEFEAYMTTKHLSYQEAQKQTFHKVYSGMEWGDMWEYGWFRTNITIPDSMQGKYIAITIGTGPEMLVYVNGQERGAIDRKHHYIMLSEHAAPGTTYEIVCECYAGHGPRLENGGPYPREVVPVVLPAGKQVKITPSYLGIWNEDYYQSAMDYLTLYSLLSGLGDRSLRAMKVAKALKEYTYIADFELEEPQRTESFIKAREVLKTALSCVNGSTAPEFTVFGQSHLDLAWLWPWEETKRKCARTYSNQLALMEHYRDYQFLLCEPPILECLQTYYPKLYQRVLTQYRNGRFIAEGGLYVECDTNIVSGESLIRQFMYGQEWFESELHTHTKMAWLPDTFGFTAALPQIMKGCHISYFATQKLLRQDPECEPFPYNLFWWEGLDKTRILSHVYMKNNAVFEPKALIERWEKHRNQNEDIDGLMFPFGYGDGGGGPTRDMLEMYERSKDLEGAPRCHMESPVKYFERYDPKQIKNTYSGELYLAWHRGTYTAQSETKKGLRKAEIAVHNAEFMICMLYLCNQQSLFISYADRIKKLWKHLMFLQFHDIVPGTSIERVQKEAEAGFAKIQSDAETMVREIMVHLSREQDNKDPKRDNQKKANQQNNIQESKTAESNTERITIYNTLSWERSINGISIPPCGYVTVMKAQLQNNQPNAQIQEHSATDRSKAVCVEEIIEGKRQYRMENQYLSAVINSTGQVTSVKCTGSDREYIDGIGNEFCMYKDVNVAYDAWELGRMYEQMPVELDKKAEVVLMENYKPEHGTTANTNAGLEPTDAVDIENLMAKTEHQAVLRIKRKLNDSLLIQDICLDDDSKYLKFDTTVHWNERHKLLKVKFPTTIFSTEAIEEIQFGCIKRPVTRSIQSQKDKYEVCNHKYTTICDQNAGAAVLNDCKYGVSVKDSCIALSLLRAPVIPDMRADQGIHRFTYAFYPYEESFYEGSVTRKAYEFNISLLIGDGSGVLSAAWLEAKNIIIETIKPAQNYGGIVLRIYEALGKSTKTVLHIHPSIVQAYTTDMLETNEEELMIQNNRIELKFGAFEIKTILLKN